MRRWRTCIKLGIRHRRRYSRLPLTSKLDALCAEYANQHHLQEQVTGPKLELRSNVARQKQLSVVFGAAKPPRARSRQSRRLAKAIAEDYATVEIKKHQPQGLVQKLKSWVFAIGEDTHACRLRASSTRSARSMRTSITCRSK